MIKGIDVSHHQGAINWPAVANGGVKFAIAKATQGRTFLDSRFKANWAGAVDSGIIPGAYHFLTSKTDGRTQADWFVSALPTNDIGILALDYERNPSDNTLPSSEQAADFLTAVREAVQRVPVIYGNPTEVAKLSNLSRYPLWIAHYTTASQPRLPAGWSEWAIWQYTSSGQIPGVTGRCDVNRAVHLEQLRALAGLGEDVGLTEQDKQWLKAMVHDIVSERTGYIFERLYSGNPFDEADAEGRVGLQQIYDKITSGGPLTDEEHIWLRNLQTLLPGQ